MENNESPIKIVFEPSSYLTDPRFSYERKYDERYYSVLKFFNFSKKFDDSLNVNVSYKESYLKKLQDLINYNSFQELSEKIKRDSMLVTVSYYKNGNLKKSITQRKLSDELIHFLITYHNLKSYQNHLIDYKNLRDQGKQQFFVLEYGNEYSTKEEFAHTKMLIENTRNAMLVMEKTEEKPPVIQDWMKFLDSTITIETSYLDYGFESRSINNIPEFNNLELEKINKIGNDLKQILETTQQNETFEK
ncbi:MAG: hypothetical protein PHP83_00475 [Clostridia bacterium]|nr:hypothetical protein [Clostridia bacterium]